MRYADPTADMLREWATWLAARPERVRLVAEKFDPWTLYRLASSGHRVFIVSFDEAVDGHVLLRVGVSGEFNALAFERTVFGIEPEDLTECDLPRPDENVGSADLDIDEVIVLMQRRPS